MIQLVLLGLQVVHALIGWLREKDLLDKGAEAEIAKVSASILVKTGVAKETLEKVQGMSEAEVDKALKELEG